MHFVTCKVALSGDSGMVVDRHEFQPVSWPEVAILQSIHGDDAVTEIKPFVSVPQSCRDEKERLKLIYGQVVENVYPGKGSQFELEMVKAKLPAQTPPWLSPIIGDVVVEEEAPKSKPEPAKASPFT